MSEPQIELEVCGIDGGYYTIVCNIVNVPRFPPSDIGLSDAESNMSSAVKAARERVKEAIANLNPNLFASKEEAKVAMQRLKGSWELYWAQEDLRQAFEVWRKFDGAQG